MNLADEGQQRNLKDFLLLYNKLTEQCFERCVVSLNRVSLSKYERRHFGLVPSTMHYVESDCIGVCTDRYVTYNQKLMFKFMEHQNLRQQAAVREAETAAAGTTGTTGTTGVAPADSPP